MRLTPYGAPLNVINLIHKIRQTGFPDPVDHDALVRLGIPKGSTSRVSQSLKYLEIIDQDGKLGNAYQRLKVAATDEYHSVLAEIVKGAYHFVFQVVDPQTATDTQIDDAFRMCEPDSQRGRMVRLFKGLCIEAGIAPKPTDATGTAKQPVGTRTKRPATQVRKKVPPGNEHVTPSHHEPKTPVWFSVLAKKLPETEQWDSAAKQRWLAAAGALVDLYIEVVDTNHEGRSKKPRPDKVGNGAQNANPDAARSSPDIGGTTDDA